MQNNKNPVGQDLKNALRGCFMNTKNNAIVKIGALVIIDYDIRLIITIIKKNTAVTDRFRFYTFLLIPISIILTFIIRNILLIFFKIDTVGDFF